MPATKKTPNPQPTCKACPHYAKGFCSRYGSIINFLSPVSACRKQKGT
jgi:hypothetical protein